MCPNGKIGVTIPFLTLFFPAPPQHVPYHGNEVPGSYLSKVGSLGALPAPDPKPHFHHLSKWEEGVGGEDTKFQPYLGLRPSRRPRGWQNNDNNNNNNPRLVAWQFTQDLQIHPLFRVIFPKTPRVPELWEVVGTVKEVALNPQHWCCGGLLTAPRHRRGSGGSGA